MPVALLVAAVAAGVLACYRLRARRAAAARGARGGGGGNGGGGGARQRPRAAALRDGPETSARSKTAGSPVAIAPAERYAAARVLVVETRAPHAKTASDASESELGGSRPPSARSRAVACMPSQTAGGRAGASPSRREPTALASAASAAGAASPALAANARRPAAAEAAERAPAVLHHVEPQLQRQRWPARDPSFRPRRLSRRPFSTTARRRRRGRRRAASRRRRRGCRATTRRGAGRGASATCPRGAARQVAAPHPDSLSFEQPARPR
jgi:hypothetical protein